MDGDILDWNNRTIQELPQAWQRSYTKLVGNLRPIQLPSEATRKKLLVLVVALPLQEDSTIWQYEMTRAQRLQCWLPGEMMCSARQAFRYTRGVLTHQFHLEPPPHVVLTQLISAPNRRQDATHFPFIILGSVFEPIGQTL